VERRREVLSSWEELGFKFGFWKYRTKIFATFFNVSI
jgi:hypothetical protein